MDIKELIQRAEENIKSMEEVICQHEQAGLHESIKETKEILNRFRDDVKELKRLEQEDFEITQNIDSRHFEV